MAILITPETRILVQGITGDFGGRHARLSLDYGTKVVAGVTPGKGGQVFEHGPHRVPIFNSVAEAAGDGGDGVGDLRAAPVCSRRDPGVRRRGPRPCRRHHRGDTGPGHGPGQAGDGRRQDAAGRPKLPGPRDAGDRRQVVRRLPDRDRPRLHPQEGPCRRGLPLGHPHVRGGLPAHGPGIGQSTCVGIGGDPVNGTSIWTSSGCSTTTPRRAGSS
jgi:succinyl-CoA synthetase alpha subunit